MIKTLRVRIKDKHINQLRLMAVAVNQVWNYVNALSFRHLQDRGEFLSAYDLHPYTKGSGKLLGLHSQTVQGVSEEYVRRRKQFKKARLQWRRSFGVRRSLGWVPVKAAAVTWENGQLKFAGKYYRVWDSYGLSQYRFKAGSFTEDARGRWYFNVSVEVEQTQGEGTASVGIDLGCKEAATDSNGDGVQGREYRKLEEKLAVAQRARNKKRVKAIHAKIANRRKDSLHKYSRKLVKENAAIFVGNVNAQAMIKNKRLAKSTLDAGWGLLKTMLSYKCAHAGIVFEEINETYTTVTCSHCRKIPDSSPKGRAGLRIRRWTCSECCVTHDRDVNAARNILALGLQRLAGEKVAA